MAASTALPSGEPVIRSVAMTADARSDHAQPGSTGFLDTLKRDNFLR